MAHKTILVHCNDKKRVGRIVGAAVELAARSQAHVVGLSISPPFLVIPAGMPGTPDTLALDERAQVYRGDNPAMKAAFQAEFEGKTLTFEWREEDAGASTMAEAVIGHARAADLIVAAQRDWRLSVSVSLDVGDRLALAAGRPVLLVPNEGVHSGIGSRVVVAWNGRREAARAAFDAIPLLQKAKEVKVLRIDPHSEDEGRDAVAFAATDLCAALARHGITCEAVAAASDGNVGATLLNRTIEYRADLLVMGCYGHSRLGEFVFGGATRHVLSHMTIPVLISH
jgi:nucleotide-binding universal stress UspA family protein